MRRDQVMFYLEPKLIQLNLSQKCVDGKLMIPEYRAATLTLEASLGWDILEFDDLWGGGTDGLTREWNYFIFDVRSEECFDYGKWHSLSLDNEELEGAEAKSFYEGLSKSLSEANTGLKYIQEDYNIKLEEIPRTIKTFEQD